MSKNHLEACYTGSIIESDLPITSGDRQYVVLRMYCLVDLHKPLLLVAFWLLKKAAHHNLLSAIRVIKVIHFPILVIHCLVEVYPQWSSIIKYYTCKEISSAETAFVVCSPQADISNT